MGLGEGLDNRCVQSVVVNVLYYSHPVAILLNSLARIECIVRDARILLDLTFFQCKLRRKCNIFSRVLICFFLWLANSPTLFEPLGLFTLYFATFTVCALLRGFQHIVMSLRQS